jgi:EmrB/QacA subfamily drug resistance transporter
MRETRPSFSHIGEDSSVTCDFSDGDLVTDLVNFPDALASASGHRRRRQILAVICLAVLVINLDTTIVNVTLPSLVRQLHSSNSQLQWVVDAYSLTFAAFVLAAGSLSDRFGRKEALLSGLAIFGIATTLGSLAGTTEQLIAARAVMGLGAAIVFPNTLSIISNVFTDRAERAKAIGLWGATTGVGIALGPIVGGWLLDEFWWGSSFLAMAPVAAVAFVLVAMMVPTSRDPATPRLDWPGLALSTLSLALLVYTIIEAPVRGWGNAATIVGFAAAAVGVIAFVLVERRTRAPMMDVAMFTNLRFSAASGSVTVSFFALAGFIFMITMYFQFMHAYSPLSTGLRLLPVAICVGIGSGVGTQLAVKVGNKAVVSTGLALMGIGFLWISRSSAHTSYLETVGQMIVSATGVGLSSAPATEAIMGVVPKEKAGIGSAINDALREVGATLGVAVIGSVFGSLYLHSIASSRVISVLPSGLAGSAKQSVGAALDAARAIAGAHPAAAAGLRIAANQAFFSGFKIGCVVAAAVALAGAVMAVIYLPSNPSEGSLLVEDRRSAREEQSASPAAIPLPVTD